MLEAQIFLDDTYFKIVKPQNQKSVIKNQCCSKHKITLKIKMNRIKHTEEEKKRLKQIIFVSHSKIIQYI